MIIKSFVGGHSVRIFDGCSYDSSIRKFVGGKMIAEIPYSGRMLSAKTCQNDLDPLFFEDAKIWIKSPQIFESVDPIPDESECDLCVVSAMYVAACKSLGIDTSRLLTIGDPVSDENNHIIGCMNLNCN